MLHGPDAPIADLPQRVARLITERLANTQLGRTTPPDALMPLFDVMFIETNPAPAKYALSVLGKCAETVRLPMVPVSEKTRAAVREAMVHAGLIN